VWPEADVFLPAIIYLLRARFLAFQARLAIAFGNLQPRTTTFEDAADFGKALKDVTARNVIQTVNFTHLDFSHTLNIAHKERLTLYDASYIAAPESKEDALVTEDEKLRKAAGKFGRALAYTRLENILSRGAQPKSSNKET
jgi:predicted nucleic acid-binding protein